MLIAAVSPPIRRTKTNRSCTVEALIRPRYETANLPEIMPTELLDRMSIRDKLTVEYYLAELSHCRCTIDRQIGDVLTLHIRHHTDAPEEAMQISQNEAGDGQSCLRRHSDGSYPLQVQQTVCVHVRLLLVPILDDKTYCCDMYLRQCTCRQRCSCCSLLWL